jgi:hypothetical protein
MQAALHYLLVTLAHSAGTSAGNASMHETSCRCQIGPKGGEIVGRELIKSSGREQMTMKVIRSDPTDSVTTYN